jgi:hypothetical protein
VGEFVDSGRVVMLGVVASNRPAHSLSSEQLAKQVASLADGLGFPREALVDRFGVSPSCGLAGASPEWARAAIELAQKVHATYTGDPDAY